MLDMRCAGSFIRQVPQVPLQVSLPAPLQELLHQVSLLLPLQVLLLMLLPQLLYLQRLHLLHLQRLLLQLHPLQLVLPVKTLPLQQVHPQQLRQVLRQQPRQPDRQQPHQPDPRKFQLVLLVFLLILHLPQRPQFLPVRRVFRLALQALLYSGLSPLSRLAQSSLLRRV